MNNNVGSNKKISQLYQQMKSSELILKPYFQRNIVWNDTHKENFLETILKGYPFPEIYLCNGETDIVKMSTSQLVVDGQQRLSTIFDYIDGNTKKLKRLRHFSELTVEEKEDFLEYIVVIRDLGKISEDEIKEVFKRINSIQYALESIEVNNALYQGEYISIAKSIASSELFSKLEILSDSAVKRMKDVDFILQIMTTVEAGGYFSYDKEVEEYIKEFDNEYPNRSIMESWINKALQLLLNANIGTMSVWSRRSMIFTVLCELVFMQKQEKMIFSPETLNSFLLAFEDKLNTAKTKEINDVHYGEYVKFYQAINAGTASMYSRKLRGELFRGKAENFLSSCGGQID